MNRHERLATGMAMRTDRTLNPFMLVLQPHDTREVDHEHENWHVIEIKTIADPAQSLEWPKPQDSDRRPARVGQHKVDQSQP